MIIYFKGVEFSPFILIIFFPNKGQNKLTTDFMDITGPKSITVELHNTSLKMSQR